MRPGAGHLLARAAAAQQRQRLVHPAPAGRRVDAAGEHLGRVLAADADAEAEPAGASSASETTCRATGTGWRNGSRYTAVSTATRRGEHGQRGRVDQRVEALAALEGDVIADAQPVDPACFGGRDEIRDGRRAARKDRRGNA